MSKKVKMIAPILSLALSFQSFAETTPVQDKRAAESEEAVENLKAAMRWMSFPTSRVCFDMATTDEKGSFLKLGGLGWMMLPGALIVDAFALPASILASPVLVGKLAYVEIKNKLAARHDQEKLSEELELFRESMRLRTEQAEKLIGDRLIRSGDLLPFTLGFTVIHSYMNHRDGLTLINGQVIREEDVDVFPKSAQDAFREMKRAKDDIHFLPANLQNEEAFMKALVERMTYANAADMAQVPTEEPDEFEYLLARLRRSAKHIEDTLKAL